MRTKASPQPPGPVPASRAIEVVAILGMHRSGTSCLAGCLEELGLGLGDVVNASPHNPKGNKENRQLRELNEALLGFNGGTWDQPPAMMEWDDELRRRRDELLADLTRGQRLWGFKDPRCVLTLPFWLEALPRMKAVATFRNPVAVVDSLLRRPGMIPGTDPLELWKIYNRKLLQIVDRLACPVVCFDLPGADYNASVLRAAGELGLAPRTSTLRFFDGNLRQTNAGGATPDEEALEIYQALKRRSL